MRKRLISVVLFAILTGFMAVPAFSQADNAKTKNKAKGNDKLRISREFALFSFSYIEDKDWQSADHYLSEAIARDSSVGFYYDLRGNVRVAERMFKDALADYTEALRLDSTDYDAHSGRAKVYYALKEYDKALIDLSFVTSADFTNAENYELKAKIELLQGNCAEAQADMEKAEKLLSQ